MITKEIFIKILRLTRDEQSNGSSLYLDDLTEHFSEDQIKYNVQYLITHGLIIMDCTNLDDIFGYAELTAKGFDYLEKNGGLTCELNKKLNTVFIKIDEEQFKALLISKVEASNLTVDQKSSVISEINNLPSDLITHLATKLLDAGLENLPNALQSIGIGL
ncbi:hypothetical protein [Acinetobacter chinensis]|uniref:hypothetical protein n=1 Tax=Acinetobacter chinensis TaxID=2004650 RepID=UPI002934246A|nr:hypothetical protein [Acinetobacter chinensis]WOE43055.1 hypothetical protein QSG87_08050 [Acinetobacter chinensis]